MHQQDTIITKFKNLWKYYLLQSLLAATVLFVLAVILGEDRIVSISAVGATAFIVFAMPKSVSAQTKHVIGGHLVGFTAGAVTCLTVLPSPVEYAVAVGIAIFLMVALDVEHPPAAGTALAVVTNEVSFNVFVALMLTAVVLTQCRYYLRGFLKDLV